MPQSASIPVILFLASCPWAFGQTSIGTIEAASATVSGTLSLTAGKAMVGANAVITARDRTATLNLSRGGEVLVCSTSALHAARGGGPSLPAPLLLALDRGAVEVHMAATAADAILTPDLRFSIATVGHPAAGLLNLRMRVAANGDTCVENRGKTAPTLEVSEQFGTGLYQIHPNQHVLFEHGSVREVVDGETSPCGCPPPPILSVANSGLSTDVTRAARPGARVADDPDEVRPHNPNEVQHPFPAAESQGLTTSRPAASIPQASASEPHAQVAATLTYNADSHGPDGAGTVSDGRPVLDASAGSVRTLPPGTPASSSAPVDSVANTSTPPPTAASPAPVPGAAPIPQPPAAPPAAPLNDTPPATTTTSSPVKDKLSDHEVADSPLPPPAPPPRTIAHRMGRFFRHLFGAQ